MADSDKVLKVLLQIQSDLQGITQLRGAVTDLKKSLDDTGQSAFSWGDAFKFAGAQEALHGVLEGVRAVGSEVIGFLESSIGKAAELQTEAFPINTLIGNAQMTAQILTGLDSLWQQFGVVSNEALANAARNLLILGTPAENLMQRLTELTKISIGAGVSLDDVVSAYQRMRFAIENGTEPMIRGMGGFGAATVEMLKLLEQSLGKTQSEVLTMFRSGQINLEDLLDSFAKAAQAGGSLADVIEQKKNTFEGAVQAMKTAWQGIELELGRPIIDSLTPVINRISEIEKAFAKIAEDEGWPTALRLAWEIVIDEVALLWQTTLGATFTKIGPAFVAGWDAMWKTINDHLQSWSDLSDENLGKLGGLAGNAFAHAFVAGFGDNLGPEMEQKKELLLQAINSITKDLPKGPEGVGSDVLPPGTHEDLGNVAKYAREVAAALKEMEAALQAVHQQQQLIQQNPLLPVEDKDRLLLQSYKTELLDLVAQIKKLNEYKSGPLDPEQLAKVNQELQRANAEVQLLGVKVAGLQRPFTSELLSWANQFGNAAQQAAHAVTGTLGTAISGVSNALTGLIFQTSNWKQAVSQAAESIVGDLIKIALQYLVSQTVIRALRAAGAIEDQAQATAASKAAFALWQPAAVAAGIATEGSAALTGLAAVLGAEGVGEGGTILHEGGTVPHRRMHSGGLAHDEVPIIAQQGEFMIRADVVRQPGVHEMLAALNAGMLFHTGGFVPFGRYHEGSDGDFEALTQLASESWADPNPGLGQPGGIMWSPSDVWGDDWGAGLGIGEYGPASYNPWANFGPTNFNPIPFGAPFATAGWRYDPDFGFVPNAVPMWNPTDPVGSEHIGQQLHSQHSGGLISRYHSGGSIGNLVSSARFNVGRPSTGSARMHSGGSVGGSRMSRLGSRPIINIHTYFDKRDAAKAIASDTAHQKIMFDFFKGRRIDLGI
jgi:hypothetical protein